MIFSALFLTLQLTTIKDILLTKLNVFLAYYSKMGCSNYSYTDSFYYSSYLNPKF